jgi:hypothetical protein
MRRTPLVHVAMVSARPGVRTPQLELLETCHTDIDKEIFTNVVSVCDPLQVIGGTTVDGLGNVMSGLSGNTLADEVRDVGPAPPCTLALLAVVCHSSPLLK